MDFSELETLSRDSRDLIQNLTLKGEKPKHDTTNLVVIDFQNTVSQGRKGFGVCAATVEEDCQEVEVDPLLQRVQRAEESRQGMT